MDPIDGKPQREGKELQMVIGKDFLPRAGKEWPPAEGRLNPWEEAWVGVSSNHRRGCPPPPPGDQSQTKGSHGSLSRLTCAVLYFDT